jgi:hypothetical protein
MNSEIAGANFGIFDEIAKQFSDKLVFLHEK